MKLPAPMPPRPHASLLFALLFALCTLNFELNAQYFTLGSDPASVRWSQIKTENFRIIFPEELDTQALYLANAFEYFRVPGSASLDVLPRKWPVMLHNRTINSNAMVPYAPKRIEIITASPQDNYPQSWLDQLVLHEFRHTAHYTSVNRGLTKALSYIFGQQAVPAILGLFVPLWFIEGDAVVIETATSQTGRGRVPSFEMKLRAQFVEKGTYSYDKAVHGSFKDFIPDHYELGYLLVGHTRIEYGKETWSKTMRKTGNIPLMMVPFSNTLYKETGFGKSRLYGHITSGLKQSWLTADKELKTNDYSPLLIFKDKFYTNRTQPAVMPGGGLIARRTSIDDIPRLVSIDTAGTEKKLLTPGYMIDGCLSASGDLVCWAELARDPRWDLRDYSVIVVHDRQTGQTRKITRKTRYFAPDLSRDARNIAAVEVDQMNQSFLLILDAGNGEVMKRFPAPGNYFLSYPAWSPDGEHIAVILTKQEGKCLAVVDVQSGVFDLVLPSTNTEISKPYWYSHYILFSGAYTGADNIFAFNTLTKKLYQVTSSRFGATDATVSPDGTRLYYANYSAGGYELVEAAFNAENRNEWDPAVGHRFDLAEKLAAQEAFIFESKAVPDSVYQIKPYRKGLNLFNFHSWAPLSIDIDHMTVNPGLSIMSQNLLGTSYTTLGYSYDMNEETGRYSLQYSYEGLYPAMSIETDYGLRRGVHTDTTGKTTSYKYDELNVAGGLRIPLNWYVKSWFMGVQPFAGYSYKYLDMVPGTDLKFKQDRFHSLDYRFFFYAQSRRSERDLNPRWGQLLELNYKHTAFDSDSENSIFAAEMVLYFPGLFRHHSFKVYGGYQDRSVDNYNYGSLISFPRGYSGIYANQALSGSATYEFPIFYPDWHIGPVLYLKRLKAAVFYDYTRSFDMAPYQNYSSSGLDLTVDFHLFRVFAPLEAGLRTIYLPDSKKVVFEILYGMNLSY